MRPKASASEQKYADLAAYYTDRAMKCCDHQLWPEALTNFGSALESLLRVRFGSGGLLNDLIKKFDNDPFFNSIELHSDTGKECATCYADRVRILRNSVHPDCWKRATQKDVDDSKILVIMLYHALIVCDRQRIADFNDAPDDTLQRLEASSIMSL
jgi:hypothetical protein